MSLRVFNWNDKIYIRHIRFCRTKNLSYFEEVCKRFKLSSSKKYQFTLSTNFEMGFQEDDIKFKSSTVTRYRQAKLLFYY